MKCVQFCVKWVTNSQYFKMIWFYNMFLTCLLCITISVNVLSIDPKIVGGFEANNEQFPYQISLKKNGYHSCGGTIVNRRHVVTAGHCVASGNGKLISIKKLKIHVGTTLKSGKGGVSYVIEKMHLPSGFSLSPLIKSDIAVLRIRGKFSFNKSVQPATLAQYIYTPGANCTISGWGRVHTGITELPENLRYAVVKIIDRPTCISWIGPQLAPDMVCAGYYNGGVDACQGDSGGPLMCGTNLTGVVSHGAGCALRGNPGIYTDVHFHNKWISDILKSSSTVIVPFVPLMFTIIIVFILR